jgi:hypothetical protein
VTGDLSLYAALQLGGVGGLLLLMLLTRKGDDSIPWAWVLGWYALAKVAEFADQAIFDATHRLIAGHTLKHLLAAAAGAARSGRCASPLTTATRRRSARATRPSCSSAARSVLASSVAIVIGPRRPAPA